MQDSTGTKALRTKERMSKKSSMAEGPRAREREGGDEAGEVERDDMIQVRAETMSGPPYSFFSTSTVIELWVGTSPLG